MIKRSGETPVEQFTTRKGRTVSWRGPMDMVTWLRAQGGVSEYRGELDALGIDNKARPLEHAKNEWTLGGLVRKDGMDLDEAARAAWEAGFLPEFAERPTVAQFLDALGETHRGGTGRRFRPGDDRLIEEQRLSERDVDAEAHHFDVDTSGMAEAEALQEVEAARSTAEGASRPIEEPELGDYAPLEGDILSPAGKTALRTAGEPSNATHAGNIDLARIESVEDIRSVLDAAAGGKFRDFGRGKQSIDETQALADDLGMDYAKLTRRSLGQAYNAEQALAARQLLAQSGENLVGLARKARGGSDEDLIAFQRAFFRHVAIQEHVAGVTREAGRALNSFKITARTEKARLAAIEQTIRGAGGRENIEALADMLGEMDGPQAINKFAREASKAKTSDKVLELWINGLLSGPQTHAVNMLSNTLTQLWTLPEHTLAATFGAARKSDKVLFREGLGRLFGLVQGAKDDVRLAGRSWLTEEPTDSTLKVEARKYQAIPSAILRPGKRKKTVAILRPGKHKKTVIPIPFSGEIQVGGKQARIPGRALMAADEFFKAVGYRSELNALAIRNGVAKGLKGRALAEHVRGTIENPPEDLSLQAKHAAAYLTYTNPLGPGGQAVQKFVARYPAARIIAPFIRTPTNIIKFASERTPFGLLMRDVRDNLRGKNGKVARDLQAARMALGSTVGIAVAALAAEGHITGGGPSDPKARAALFATDWQPYSVKIGDGYHAFSRLEPAGMILGVSADFAEIAGEITKEERDSVGAMILGSITKNLVSKTWLQHE